MKKHLLYLVTLFVALFVFNDVFAQGIIPKKDEKKNLWGYFNTSTGKWVVKPKFETASEFITRANGKQRAEVSLKGKQGFVDETGKPLGAGIVFEKIEPLEGDAMFVTVKGKKGVANYDGIYLVKPEAEDVEQLGSEGWIMTVKSKKGILKKDGTYLIEPIYSDIDASIPGYFIVTIKDKAGLMQRDASVVVSPKKFTSMKPFEGNYWTVNEGKKVGLMDVSTGNVIIKPKYEEIIGAYLNGTAFIVKNGDKTDILNGWGNRRMRFGGYNNISIEEIPEFNAIWLDLGTKNYVYCCDNNVAYPIEVSVENLHGFTRKQCRLVKGVDYTESDKKVLAPFLERTYFTSPLGTTNYLWGEDISKNIFLMYDNQEQSLKLFKDGSFEPLGVIKEMPNRGQDCYELKSGDFVDANGDFLKPILFKNNIVAYENLNTGKYKIGNQEYDKVNVTNNPRPYDRDHVYIAKKGDKLFLLDSGGKIKSEVDANSILEIGESGMCQLITDQTCKIGLKYEDKVIVEPIYDNILMIVIFDQDREYAFTSSMYKLYKDGKVGMFDVATDKIVIPIERGYTSIGGEDRYHNLEKRLYDSGLCYIQTSEDSDDEMVRGLCSIFTGKEILKPSADNLIETLPTGYKGFKNKGIAYSPDGRKLSLPASVDVYQSEWANSAPHFFVKLAGLKDRTVEFQITAYDKNGAIYRNLAGEKCIYTFSQTATPESVVEYGPKVAAYVCDDIHVPRYSEIVVKFVLSAKDAKTGAPIPVKGEKSVSAWFKRGGI